MRNMDAYVRNVIKLHGIRNALLAFIPPTETISLFAGDVISGIESVFAYAYTHKLLQNDGSQIGKEVMDHAVQMWLNKLGNMEFPAYFVNS